MYRSFLKRAIDIIVSLTAIIVLSVPMVVIAIAVKLTSRGPAFFKQKRLGRGKREFYILKFRTMRLDAPADVPTCRIANPDKWITPIGRFLRRTSIDELPQLFNILIGQMSLVGPRPTVAIEDELITEREKYGVYSARPGLTGWAQIHGRDSITDTEKARLDGEYIARLSGGFFRGILVDLRCIIGTFAAVFKGECRPDTDRKEAEKTAKADTYSKNLTFWR